MLHTHVPVKILEGSLKQKKTEEYPIINVTDKNENTVPSIR